MAAHKSDSLPAPVRGPTASGKPGFGPARGSAGRRQRDSDNATRTRHRLGGKARQAPEKRPGHAGPSHVIRVTVSESADPDPSRLRLKRIEGGPTGSGRRCGPRLAGESGGLRQGAPPGRAATAARRASARTRARRGPEERIAEKEAGRAAGGSGRAGDGGAAERGEGAVVVEEGAGGDGNEAGHEGPAEGRRTQQRQVEAEDEPQQRHNRRP